MSRDGDHGVGIMAMMLVVVVVRSHYIAVMKTGLVAPFAVAKEENG